MPENNNNNSHAYLCNGNSFQNFFEVWLLRQREYMNQLLFLSSQTHVGDNELKRVVGQVLLHYQRYYEAKSTVAYEDIFTLFSPPWFSTFERSFLWIAGFKPGIMFKIMQRSVGSELTVQQMDRIEGLKAGTTTMERGLSNEMARIQESMGGPMWMEIVRRMERQTLDWEVDQLTERISEAFRDLVINADILRKTTSRELVDILSPIQAVRFLAAVAKLQLKVRTWGLQRDVDRMVS